MTLHLLDVNVLIALLDPGHEAAQAAGDWFERIRRAGWATCPLTENGVIRILSSPKYRRTSSDPVEHANLLDGLCQLDQHYFWPDDLSIRHLLTEEMRLASSQITDLYLLALATEHGGKFATFDRKIPARFVEGGIEALEVIPH